ncbi:hypothetical protein B5E65_06990 [Gemmiger sp. An120]|uniref:TetR/AcrR family transcriptional regulator n=1 Tax=Gemmiger sp. An120 TaxID=1965549 RepID=UPI000B378F33|nr:TetR/AcrR family transcriptional regulator [Gemmiger sp. An120]OUQ42689.1 hypothetical protein B5E65_06990 [Gemmiger sp. An120]
MTDKYQARRTALLEEIYELVDREGYEALRVRYLCGRLGISTGTFYHYFPEKYELHQLLYRRIDEHFQRRVQPRFTEDEAANLSLFAECYADYCVQTGVAATRCFMALPLQQPAGDLLSEKRPISQVLEGIFERGKAKNQFLCPYSARECARYTMVVLRGFCSDWAKRDGSYDLVEAVRRFFPISLAGLRG